MYIIDNIITLYKAQIQSSNDSNGNAVIAGVKPAHISFKTTLYKRRSCWACRRPMLHWTITDVHSGISSPVDSVDSGPFNNLLIIVPVYFLCFQTGSSQTS